MGKSVLFLILLLAVSVRTQTEQCPGQLSILPCLCYIFEDRPSIQCNQIADEDQLEDIFSADFPEPNLQFFTLYDSPITRLSRNVFGSVTFNQIIIDVQYLHEISEDAFENSNETLVNLDIVFAPITQTSFPFESLGKYTRLVQLAFSNNLFTEFPTIISESLRFLVIQNNLYLTTIPSEALASVGNLTFLDLQRNGIATFDNGAFSGLDQLEYIRLRGNNIVNIPDDLFSYLPSVVEIDLSSNDISDIVSGALSNLPSLVELDLGYNKLQTISVREFDFNPELEIIELMGNEITYVTPGSFDNLPSLQLIDLGFNNLSRLNTGMFRGVNVTEIYVDRNVINYIEVNAFGTVSSSTINLIDNLLTNVYDYWLQPLLDAGNYVELLDNQITCGCEISWLFSDPSYQQNLIFVCENGTDFAVLDPDYYTQNC